MALAVSGVMLTAGVGVGCAGAGIGEEGEGIYFQMGIQRTTEKRRGREKSALQKTLRGGNGKNNSFRLVSGADFTPAIG